MFLVDPDWWLLSKEAIGWVTTSGTSYVIGYRDIFHFLLVCPKLKVVVIVREAAAANQVLVVWELLLLGLLISFLDLLLEIVSLPTNLVHTF